MAVEQVAEIPSGQTTRRGDIATLAKGGIGLLRVAVSIIDHIRRASRISMALWSRNTTAAAKSFLFALLRDIAPAAARADSRRRARIFIAEKCKGGKREYPPRGQSAPAKEGTDISRRKRRFRVVVPLFAVGIIIGLPGNPGRAARWLVRFRVRWWKPTKV